MANSLNTIEATFDNVVEELKGTRFVACVEAYPVCPARMGSQQIVNYFDEHPHEFVTNDGRAIYYSDTNILNLHKDLHVSISGQDVRDYLIREYAHLFLQHSRLRRYYNKDELKANTFAVACEIEACRTKGIAHSRTCYQTSATDDLFECTKDAKHLRQIYKALLDEYGDEIENFAEQQQPQQGGEDGERDGNSNQQSGDGSQSDGDQSGDNSGDQSGDGDGQSGDGGNGDDGSSAGDGSDNSNRDGNSGDGNQGKNGQDTGEVGDSSGNEQSEAGRGDKSSGRNHNKNGKHRQPNNADQQTGNDNGNSKNSQQSGEQQQRDSDVSSSYDGKLTEKQREKLAQTFSRAQGKLSPADGDDQMLQDYDYTACGESEEASIDELVDLTYERWSNRQVKKQMAKLKSAIEGEVSKKVHPTYARPSRRACTANGLLTKGRKKDLVGQPTILVALDASGSMSAQRVKDLTTSIGNIFDDLGRPKKGCYICMFDSDIIDYKPMRQWKSFIERYHAGGGTYYPSVLELANELEVDVVIEVGDGEGRLTDDYRHSTALKTFMDNDRKWIDLLVIRNKEELSYAYNTHISFDERVGGVKRIPICLDKNMAQILETQYKKS